MASYDSPRPTSQPVGATDLAVAKDNLITFDNVINGSTGAEITNRKGQSITPLVDVVDIAQSQVTTAINAAVLAAGYQFVGDFADATKVEITSANQVYTSKSVLNYEDAVWRTNQTLPYTPTGSDPTSGVELGKWVAVAIGELKSIARALNVQDSAVIYSTDTTALLDGVSYVHDASKQVTYCVPTLNGTGETIVSVQGGALVTSTGETYQMYYSNNEVHTIANIAHLRALITPYEKVWVSGYHEEGDGAFGSRIFAWDSSSKEDDNNGTTIKLNNVNVGRYILQRDSYVYPEWFGARTDGTDCKYPFRYMFASLPAEVRLTANTYTFTSELLFYNLNDVNIIGASSGQSVINVLYGWFVIMGPKNVHISDIHFKANSISSLQDMFVSNFNHISFRRCRWSGFGSGDGTVKNASSCLTLIATDADNEKNQPGDSIDAVVDDCIFYGNNLDTGRAVRAITPWDTAATSSLSNVRVTNCTMDEFNWNPATLSGLTTTLCLIENCTLNRCGLSIEIDKGASCCTVRNIRINRLLGNKDKELWPDTIIALASISGVSSEGGFGYNNLYENVQATLLKSDLDLFNIHAVSGAACANMAYNYNSTIKNVTVSLDGAPIRTYCIGMAMCTLQTTSGCIIENILCENATEGVMQNGYNNSAMNYELPTIIRGLRCVTPLNSQIVYVCADSDVGASNWVSVEDCVLSTNLTNPYYTSFNGRVYAVVCNDSRVSGDNFLHLKNCVFTMLGDVANYFCFNRILNVALDTVTIIGGASDRLIHSEDGSKPENLYLKDIFVGEYGETPLMMQYALNKLDQTCSIREKICIYSRKEMGSGGVLYSTAPPAFPPASYWSKNIKIENYAKTSGGYSGWTVINGVWKGYGIIEA